MRFDIDSLIDTIIRHCWTLYRQRLHHSMFDIQCYPNQNHHDHLTDVDSYICKHMDQQSLLMLKPSTIEF